MDLPYSFRTFLPSLFFFFLFIRKKSESLGSVIAFPCNAFCNFSALLEKFIKLIVNLLAVIPSCIISDQIPFPRPALPGVFSIYGPFLYLSWQSLILPDSSFRFPDPRQVSQVTCCKHYPSGNSQSFFCSLHEDYQPSQR